MASCKSYRNRLKEIAMLRELLGLAQQELDSLSLRVRLYREYILKTYHDADFIDLVDIPSCLKPLDSIKYVTKNIK
jgi:hypothetical protein